jgi:hypothetical protein
MGTPEFRVQTSLDQEIFFQLAPNEQVGPVRAIKFEDLDSSLGSYDVDGDWRATIPRSSGLYQVMTQYQEMIDHARKVDPKNGGLPNAKATLIISQLQPHLVGVTLRITWDDVKKPGNTLSNELLVPVHQYGYPEGGE